MAGGKRGPPPTPNNLLYLRGSRQPETRGEEPRGDGGKPRAPGWMKLTAAEKRVFRFLASAIHGMQICERFDSVALGRYVRMISRWLECEAWIDKNGQTYVRRGKSPGDDDDGNPIPGPILEVKLWPQVRESRMLSEKLLQVEREFGLTPAARTRLAGIVDGSAAKSKGAAASGQGSSRFLSSG